jgi:hypothetical protein
MSEALSVALVRCSAASALAFTSNVSANDTVSIGSRVYKFETTGDLAAAYDVAIGTDLDESIGNLVAAINASGTAGTEYFAGTLVNPFVVATADLANDEIDLVARVPGIMGDGIALAATSPGANTITAGAACLGLVGSATRGSGSERAFVLAIDTDGLQPNSAILSVIDQYRNESAAQS